MQTVPYKAYDSVITARGHSEHRARNSPLILLGVAQILAKGWKGNVLNISYNIKQVLKKNFLEPTDSIVVCRALALHVVDPGLVSSAQYGSPSLAGIIPEGR